MDCRYQLGNWIETKTVCIEVLKLIEFAVVTTLVTKKNFSKILNAFQPEKVSMERKEIVWLKLYRNPRLQHICASNLGYFVSTNNNFFYTIEKPTHNLCLWQNLETRLVFRLQTWLAALDCI